MEEQDGLPISLVHEVHLEAVDVKVVGRKRIGPVKRLGSDVDQFRLLSCIFPQKGDMLMCNTTARRAIRRAGRYCGGLLRSDAEDGGWHPGFSLSPPACEDPASACPSESIPLSLLLPFDRGICSDQGV